MQPLQSWQALTKPPGRMKALYFPQDKANCAQLAEATPGPRPFPSAQPAVFREKIKSAQSKDKGSPGDRGGVTSASHQGTPRVTQPFRYRQPAPSPGRMPDLFLCVASAVLVCFSIFIPIQKTLCLAHASGSLPHPVIRLEEAAASPAKAIWLRKPSKSHQTFKGLSSPPTAPGEGSSVGSCLLPSAAKALDTNRS